MLRLGRVMSLGLEPMIMCILQCEPPLLDLRANTVLNPIC